MENQQTGTDDPACWNNSFELLFTGEAQNVSDFDVIRFMTHGSVDGIKDSEEEWLAYESYITGNDLIRERNDIKNEFDDFYPVFVFDACLVGLVDDNETIVGSTNAHFLNALLPLNIRGAYAASGLTWTPHISKYNEYFTQNIYEPGVSLGKAATVANKKGGDIDDEKQRSYHSFIMNLYGCPWASVQNPNWTSLKNFVSKTYNSIIDLVPNVGNRNKINIDCSNFNISSGDFDVLSIEDFELLNRDESTPVIPRKTLEINIPTNSTVENVTVTFGNESAWDNLNIPAYQPPPPMPTPGVIGGYIECPSGNGIYPAEQYKYRIVEMEDYKVVMVTVFPVTFNTDTHKTTLYKDVNIEVQYSTSQLGILNEFSVSKKRYSVNETVETSTLIQNISASEAEFSATVNIEDSNGSIVATQSQNLLIPSNEILAIGVNITAPSTSGSYTLNLSVSDGANIIGESSRFIKVESGKILYFETPSEIEVGSYGNFVTNFQNLSGNQIDALESIFIYNNKNEVVAKPPQISKKIGAGESGIAEIQWFPPEDLPNGTYKAQLVVTVGETEFIEFNKFSIKSKAMPGDFDGDGDVDRDDINIINTYLNQPATECPECDLTEDGFINILDTRTMMGMCTRPRCAVE